MESSPLFRENEKLKQRISKLEESLALLVREYPDHGERFLNHDQAIRHNMIRSQRLEMIGVLADGIAHDFNNLLTIIQGNAQIAMMDLHIDDPCFCNLDQVLKASNRAAKLTRQLLAFSRRQIQEPHPMQVNDILDSLQKMLTRILGEKVTMKLELASDLWMVSGDECSMEQIFLNLAICARDNLPCKGVIRIVTENLIIQPPRSTDENPQHCIRISFRDDSHLLAVPYCPDTQFGLVIVKNLVDDHHGWIDIQSDPIVGSKYQIFFPALDEPEDYTEEKPNLSKYIGSGEQILVVEDDSGVRNYLSRILTRWGYQVTSASSVQEALSAFSRNASIFDLIFTDVFLADHNGFFLAEEIWKIEPEMMILFGSGYTPQTINRSAFHNKHFHFIQKPYTLEGTLLKIRELLLLRIADDS